MRSIVPLIPLLAAMLLLGSCSGSKSYAKRATKLDQAGLYAEAAEMYLQAVQRNQKNVDAKIGLKKTGQLLLNDRLSEFFKASNMGSKADAVEAYLAARAYQERVGYLGVVLEIPDHYKTDFERIKGEYLIDLYNQGQDLIAKEDFASAQVVFGKISRLDPDYKDASSLKSVAYMEPLYRSGRTDLEAGRYRRAYENFTKVIETDPGYKDAGKLRQECLTKGQYNIAVLPFTNTSGRPEMAARVQAHAMTALTETRDPFLRIVDRENMDRILAEQRLSLSGMIDEQTAVRVGNLMGAQAVLMGSLIEYREEPGQLRKSTKDGFEARSVEQTNPETGEKYVVTNYVPVKYHEFFQENKAYMSFSYRLVSLETGEVLLSRVVERHVEDHMYYANYDGNKDRLVANKNGVADVSDRTRRELRSLLNAPRSLKPMATLTNELLASSTSGMATLIQQELNSKLP